MYLALVLVGLVVVVAVLAAMVWNRRRAVAARRIPKAGADPDSLLADRDDEQTEIERTAREETSDPASASGRQRPEEQSASDGVFRVSLASPGPAADEVLGVFRKHCRVQEVGNGEYDVQMHDDMQSGTAMSQMSYVLDREHPDWRQRVSMRPADDP